MIHVDTPRWDQVCFWSNGNDLFLLQNSDIPVQTESLFICFLLSAHNGHALSFIATIIYPHHYFYKSATICVMPISAYNSHYHNSIAYKPRYRSRICGSNHITNPCDSMNHRNRSSHTSKKSELLLEIRLKDLSLRLTLIVQKNDLLATTLRLGGNCTCCVYPKGTYWSANDTK